MKALDTNVIVRYLVQDDPAQGKRAAAFIERAAEAGDQILIGNIVLCETIWVLESAYGYARSEIEVVLEKLLQSNTFVFEAKDVLWSAFADFQASPADFSDCLIGQLHRTLGCEPTVTFDTALRRLATFRAL